LGEGLGHTLTLEFIVRKSYCEKAMAQAALGRTVVAAGGTLLVLGGATMVVSTVSMAVTKLIVDRSKVIPAFDMMHQPASSEWIPYYHIVAPSSA
jgi:hypothetical protein